MNVATMPTALRPTRYAITRAAPIPRCTTLCSGFTSNRPRSLVPSVSATPTPPVTKNPATPTARYTAPSTPVTISPQVRAPARVGAPAMEFVLIEILLPDRDAETVREVSAVESRSDQRPGHRDEHRTG